MEKKISVIVPMYGVEDYVEQCVKTIKEQTYPNLEILLIDDGSPDRCGEIADQLALTDERIRVIHKVNGGLSDARNVGIESATGDYLTFIDSDDYIHPQMMECLLFAAGDGDKEISVCSYQMVYENNKPDAQEYDLGEQNVQDIDGKEIQKIYLHQGSKRLNYTVAWAKLYKKECFSEIRYPKGKLHEDEYTTFQLLYEAEHIGYIDLPLYFYLSRETSIMGEFKAKRFDVFGGYARRITYYMKHQESQLAKDTYFLGLHMMAQYNAWMNHKNEACTNALMETWRNWRTIWKTYRREWKLSRTNKIEGMIVAFGFRVYFFSWKMMKKKQKRK